MNREKQMKRKIIDWGKVWFDFNSWICKLENTKACEHCGSRKNCFPDWDDQEAKIQELVDAQVREIIKKKI